MYGNTPTDRTATDRIVMEHERRHEAPDGTSLAANVFRPASSDDDPVPTLLQRTPYGKPDAIGLGSPRETPLAAEALLRGYAVVYEDTRGRGTSGGAFRPWVHEAEDGARTIEWLAERPWSDGRVGTFGGSSAGTTQVLAAAADPDPLEAVALAVCPSDIHGSDFFQDGAMHTLAFLPWSLGVLAAHTVERLHRDGALTEATRTAALEAAHDAMDDLPALATHRPLAELPERVFGGVDLPAGLTPADLVPHWAEWLSHPEYDDFWASFNSEEHFEEMRVPGLHITGWADLCQHGALANFHGMDAETGADQYLLVGPWEHGSRSERVGAVDFGARAAGDAVGVTEKQLAFFEAYLRGTGPFDESPVRTFRMGAGGGDWTAHDAWPPAAATERTWYLRSSGAAASDPTDGGLSGAPPGEPAADAWRHDPADPVPTRGGPLCCRDATRPAGMFDQTAIEARPDVLTYTTPPLERPLELAGPGRASLTVATDAADGDLFVRAIHVTEAAAYNLCDGIRRFRFRAGRDRAVPVPDGPFEVPVTLWDVHHRLPAGDRLRIEVMASNWPRFDVHPGTTDPWRTPPERVAPAEHRLLHGPDHPSSVTLTTVAR